MDKKLSDTINNVCTILGGALILYPLIDEATKTLVPEMQKLASGETLQELKMLPDKQEKHDILESKDSFEHDVKRKPHDDEIALLKRRLAEYESKSDEHKSGN